MPKGVYERKDGLPRGRPKKEYPPDMVREVQRLYIREGMSQTEVAAELGVSLKVIYKLMINHNIPRRPQVVRSHIVGPAHPLWKDASEMKYAGLHRRVEKARGKPRHCSACDSTTKARYEWANLTGRYEDVYDYVRMCVSCHRKFDGARRNQNGGARTSPNRRKRGDAT